MKNIDYEKYIECIDTRIWNCICKMSEGKWAHGFTHDKIMAIVKEALDYIKKD